MNSLLDWALTAYSYLPHHPWKGRIYDRILPRMDFSSESPRLRTRFGVAFECDLADKLTREIYFSGFDRRDCRVLRRLIRPGHIILDAGANVGYFSLLCAKWLRGEGTVYAFEPFPSTMARLELNLDLNPGLDTVVQLRAMALSDFTGTISMAAPNTGNSGCNYLRPQSAGTVAVSTLDCFVEQERISRLDLIKIDVEGSEAALLEGATSTLKRFRPILMIEINPGTLCRFGKTAADLVSLLGHNRYRLAIADRFGKLKTLSRLPVEGEEPNVFGFPID